MSAISPADASQDRRWLVGPATDLLLGCGLGYALWIAVVPWLGLDANALAAAALIVSVLLAGPHYGATLLRVYGSQSDFRKYRVFTVWISAVVWLCFVVGLYDLRVGSFLITLYFTWSPWHYTGQNYGIAVMYLRRRGVPLPPLVKRALYTAFLLSFALAFSTMHQAVQLSSYGVSDFMGSRYSFLPLGIPPAWHPRIFAVLLAAYAGATVFAGALLLRRAPARDLLPVAAIALTQALWFSLPHTYAFVMRAPIEQRSVAFLFVWAILGHSVQYLWVTTAYAAGKQSRAARARYLLATLAAGSAIWTLPALVFSPQLLGTHPYGMGLFLMIAAAVNVQHFALDGAIWKLRDTGVGRILIGGAQASGEASPRDPSWPSWMRGAAWASGLALAAVALVGASSQVAYSRAVNAGDVEGAQRSRALLAALGRDDPHFALSDALDRLAEGDSEAALAALRESTALYPTADAWLIAGRILDEQGNAQAALGAYKAAVELDPSRFEAWHRAGLRLLERGNHVAALDALRRAKALAPADPRIAADLARAESASTP